MGMGISRFFWLLLIQIVYYIVVDSNKISGQMYMEDECSALFKLKQNLKFDSEYYTMLQMWNSSTDCCSWIGVTCENNHIIGIDLKEKNIIGGLNNSSSLFDLQYLKILNLSENQFSAPIPVALGRLINLEYLELSDAGFMGQIPMVIARMKKLRSLDLSGNQLYLGPLTLELLVRDLSSLEKLSLDGLDLSGNSLSFIGNLQLSKLSLERCNLTGDLPKWIRNLTRLEYLSLSYNWFTGPLLDLSDNQNVYSSTLLFINLRDNMLQGAIPMSLYNLQYLGFLDLSFNNFSGTVELSDLMRLRNLKVLSLSYNSLSISIGNSNSPWFPYGIKILSLASCNLMVFPNLINGTQLRLLDLSNNHLQGEIPNWIWDISGVNLSYNLLETFESLHQENSNVISIDLHHNMLTGQIPVFPQQAMYVDYSFNSFTSTIPSSIGDNVILLDLSNNKLKGAVPGNISRGCSLRTLDLNNNMLEGEVPINLANCASLVVVNLGNNRIHDRFPCWLKRLPNLRVLVLNSNEFNGPLKCPNTTNWNLWQSLQIIDLSNNYFFGDLPSNFFSDWKAMTKASTKDHPTPEKFIFGNAPYIYMQPQLYEVTIVMSGQEWKLEYIWDGFSAIDLSSNMFSGEIPGEIGGLTAVHALNVSHNALTGPIPSTLGNMRELQWLDLSHNSLNGTIPGELGTLSFLAILNLSFNQLEGVIPTGTQFQNSPETAFVGNKGLCGFPLKVSCRDTGGSSLPPDSPNLAHAGSGVKWDFMVGAEVGSIFGLAIVIGPLVLYERWRRYYFMHLDNVLRNVFETCRLMERRAKRPIRSLRRNN